MADFSAGLQTWQEERYVILLSYFFWGEDLHDNCASHPPSNCDKKGGGCTLIQDWALNRVNTVLYLRMP